MSNGISLEGFDAHLVATMEETEAQPESDGPFRVALIGDWSGRSNRGLSVSGSELAHWRPRLVDRDNLDQTMAQLGVKLVLPLRPESNSSLTFDFNKLDDFHPDRIFERSELFQALRELRARLSNPKTFQQAAEEVRLRLDISEPPPPVSRAERQPESEARDSDFSGGSLLDQVLARSGVELSSESRPPADDVSPDLRALVQEAVRPYLLPDQSEQESLTAAIDKAIGEQMRAVFHHPDFQALEAAWRALDFLVSRVETGTELKLYLLDISREELAAAILANEAVQTTGIYKLLVDATVKTFGGERWAVLAGNYLFDLNAQDAELLRRLSIVARDAGAPFIGGATSRVVGCESLVVTPEPEDWQEAADAGTEDAWKQLRRLPTAKYLGLALPRFLLRLPYGHDTDPAETFDFEEMAESDAKHERYLWANPAFAVTYLLAQAFSQSGWDLRPGEVQEIDGLPLHIYQQHGETQIKPCAEVLMTVAAAERIIDRGPMPLITMKGTDTVRLGMFQSLASPPTSLAGRWGR